jgi:ribosome-associated heat shock protein Hsp15
MADSAVTRKLPETDSDAARRTVSEPVRLDKWLWAARFFKTRSLAAKAVEGGKVRLNGESAKPSRDIRCGDELAIRAGELEWVVEVKALSRQRGPAAQAALLYAEREDSRTRRQAALALRKAQPHPAAGVKGRPTKKDRRLIHRFTGS